MQRMNGAIVFQPGACASFARGDGIRTTPLVTRAAGATVFLNGSTRFAPGASVPLHFHNCDESVAILSGCGLVEIAGETHAVAAHQITFLPAGTTIAF